MFKQFDLSIVKRVDIVGRVNAEFRLDALNVFNNVNFSPVSGITVSTTQPNRERRTSIAPWARRRPPTRRPRLTGVNTSRVLQIVSRIRW